MNATETMMRVNMRRKRAEGLAHALFAKIRDSVSYEAERRVFDAIFDVMTAEGVEVLTDQMRHEMGLSPRGPEGWTLEEIIALEERRLAILSAPIVSPVTWFPDPPSALQVDQQKTEDQETR